MKNKILIYQVVIFGFISTFFLGCKKDNQIDLPTLTTLPVTEISYFNAKSGGNLLNEGGSNIISRGLIWDTADNVTLEKHIGRTSDGSGIGLFTSNIKNLKSNTVYNVKAYAINNSGAGYGNKVTFKTEREAVIDISGNVYDFVTIGTKVWMADNLKTTKYNDNSDIPLVTDSNAWNNLTTPGYCWFNNDDTFFKPEYGALYNCYTVNTGKLCPTGWHVPSDQEWTDLTTYLGGYNAAGGKLKEEGFAHWGKPNTGATNETGFTALPGGQRFGPGSFDLFKGNGYWWSSTEFGRNAASYRRLDYNSNSVYAGTTVKIVGFSVRCVRD